MIKKQSPPMKIPKPIKYCLLFLLFSVLLLAALIGSMYYTHENYTGTFLHAHAKYGEVQVYRNDYNIPTIIAKNQ